MIGDFIPADNPPETSAAWIAGEEHGGEKKNRFTGNRFDK